MKIRGVNVSVEGAAREFDQVNGGELLESWSLTDGTQPVAAIAMANRGMDIQKVFNKSQVKLIDENYSYLDWNSLVPFGPVCGVKVWKRLTVGDLPLCEPPRAYAFTNALKISFASSSVSLLPMSNQVPGTSQVLTGLRV